MEIEFQGIRITQGEVDKWFESLSPTDKERISGKSYSKNKIDFQKMKIKKKDTTNQSTSDGDYYSNDGF
jgi:hypothetical protein